MSLKHGPEISIPTHLPDRQDWEDSRAPEEREKEWWEESKHRTPAKQVSELDAAINDTAAWDRFTENVPLVVHTGSPIVGDLPISATPTHHPHHRQ